MLAEFSCAELSSALEPVVEFLNRCLRHGERMDQVERGLHEQLRVLGLKLVEDYVKAAGDGDQHAVTDLRGYPWYLPYAGERFPLEQDLTPIRLFANALRAEGHNFTVFTPNGGLRMALAKSADDFIEFALDNPKKINFLSFQPVSFTGRDEEVTPERRAAQRYTLSHLAHDVKNQMQLGEPVRDWFPISFVGTFTDWADHVHGPKAEWGNLTCGCHPNCGVGMAVMIDKETKEAVPVTDENATTAAFRTGLLQTVSGNGTANGSPASVVYNDSVGGARLYHLRAARDLLVDRVVEADLEVEKGAVREGPPIATVEPVVLEPLGDEPVVVRGGERDRELPLLAGDRRPAEIVERRRHSG